MAAATAEAMTEAACGGNGGGDLFPREAAASALSRSSAKALSKGVMSIIGEIEVALLLFDEISRFPGEVGLF